MAIDCPTAVSQQGEEGDHLSQQVQEGGYLGLSVETPVFLSELVWMWSNNSFAVRVTSFATLPECQPDSLG